MTSTRATDRSFSASRRRLLQGAASTTALALAVPSLARAAEPIKVGVLQPLSGGLENLGQQGVQGTRLAIEEANEAGGVRGRRFELVIADDKTDPKTAVERTRELIQRDRVVAIFGPVTSANRDAIQPTIERFKTPLFYATDYEGGVCSRYIVCYSGLPEQWVSPFVPFLKQSYGDTFYMFGSDYVWPRKMNEAVRRAAEQVGGRIVGEEYTPFGVKDFTSTVRKVEQSGAKVLVLDVVGADAITFVKQFVAAGGKAKTKLAWLGYSENYIPGLTRDESEGIVTVANFTSTLDKPEAKAFVAKVRKRFGEGAIVSNTVDAHYMLTRFFVEGVKRAGAVDREKIIDSVTGFPLQSGNGMVRLRPDDRHADLNVVIAETRDRRQVLLKDLGLVKAQSQCKG
ncbi:MAG: aliphatic amidase expression-regulating protein [Candidatus Rokubacteria bacterium 13_2_20CM_2_70_11]|nr:MAG: aliphatic amidase expression-regulating protein [Candidatus Rokubacteria bacterium 13_2_20CM_2_70_11]